jgi:hypothetical protein
MKRSSALVSALATAIIGLMTPAAGADPNNQPATFQLHMERPNVSEAPNGDRVAVTGSGVFSVHPKSVAAAGTFTHTDASGNIVGSGIWTATQLLSFEFYGCGVITFADPDIVLPPNFCGGALKMRVLLTAGSNQFEGVLTVFCIVGPQTPESHDEPPEEGVTLNVADVINFNKIVTGMNIYIRTS